LIVKEIMPILIAKNNAIQLLIAGANPSAQMMAYSNNNIAVKAWVPDIRDAYADAKIFIAPLHTGAGLQNKLLEAMSMQMPCITTSICNNALHAIENKEILTANTTHEFVEKINTLLQNTELQTQLGSNARQMIIRKFDWASANSILIDLLTSVINKQK
jgi:glycosyltransferase involved in cell wall biosynthesis